MAETRLIQGRYRLLDVIGRGGMGEVWRAVDESLGRHVAVKCLKPMAPERDATFTTVLRERFRREARVAAALQHRGVTVVHDFGEYEGVLYLVMELLEGHNLSQLLEENSGRPLAVHEVVDIAEQVADALAYTHERGIVHRDLKPANIMRLTDGAVKICDFGIARLGEGIGASSQLTGVGVAMGTPHYMSPEQIGGGPVDHRSDLYSLGCVLYEIATGVPPFDHEDAWAVLVGHRDTPPPPLHAHRDDLPDHFQRLVLELLAKTPEGRPADAKDLGRRIARQGRAVPPPLAAPSSVHGPSGPAASAGPFGPTGPAGPAGPPGAGLPPWSRGMTAGHKAVDTGLRTVLPDHTAGLTGEWTTLADPRGRAPGAPRATVGRPVPSPELLVSLTGRHNAGLSLGRLGRWEEAGEVHRAVAAEREHALGPDHPHTLDSRYEVAFTLIRTGRADDALRELRRVADGRRRTLGPDHPGTLTARQETAYVLGQLGRHLEANEVYTAVLAARRRSMGADHPDTLRCGHNLAFNLSRLGRLEDSFRLVRDIAAARARVLGAEHPDTLVTRYEMADVLGRLGRWTQALDVYREVAAARARALGPDHPHTLAARYEAGISLGRLGRSAEALDLYRALVDDSTRTQGPDDPETLRARHGLVVSLGRLGRCEEALAEARETVARRERVLGPEHPDTLVSHREVAVGLGRLGLWDEALAVYGRVAAARERVLGADHPDTLVSRNDEAHCLEQLGRRAEAVALYRRVAALRDHRTTPHP
ncbi:tetratricopeptide repeat protein [Streptomyces sp. NPDC020141]|uniref:serine/threonine-protein kinase n=1 Tax=Streptomyces sp. NPDC020141 TaxID=3365065 RepID=UPI0037BD0B66